ncbi:MAG: DUF3291 domain-containing protein [Bacteroidota bacterium]
MVAQFHLAQINISRLLAPLDDPMIKEFNDFIDPVNKLGEDSPGFVWRLKDESGASSSHVETPFDDDIIVNFTVWENLESLYAFSFTTVHAYFLKNRNKWFGKYEGNRLAMWWIPAGHIPSLEEGVEKLRKLDAEGPSPEVFTFKVLYGPDGTAMKLTDLKPDS